VYSTPEFTQYQIKKFNSRAFMNARWLLMSVKALFLTLWHSSVCQEMHEI